MGLFEEVKQLSFKSLKKTDFDFLKIDEITQLVSLLRLSRCRLKP